MKQLGWNRRRFVQLAGGSTMLGAVSSRLSWAAASAGSAKFAFVGGEQGIHVFRLEGANWVERQVVTSEKPAALALSANGRHLYVANAIDKFGTLPRGSVEAFGVNVATGRLTQVSRVALSLSGVVPRHLAISPDGKSLVVAINGGGAYNVLPIKEDGRLGHVTGILKETGSGPHAMQDTARPEMVAFDGAGRVLAADLGADRVSVMALEHGTVRVTERNAVAAGSGPSKIVLDPTGWRLYVASALDGSVACYGYDAASGRILDRKQQVSTSVAGEAAMAMHPAGSSLYTSHGAEIAAWKIDRTTGALRSMPAAEVSGVHTLSVSGDGKSLLALTKDAVLRMNIDAVTGELCKAVKVASVAGAASIAAV